MTPPLETDCREQKAVFWANNGDDNYGEVTLAAAVNIDVRWEETKGFVVDARGNNVAYNSKVIVDREMAVGSILWRGEIDDLPGTGTETPVSLIYKVLTYLETPDLKNRNYRRFVLVTRHSDQLPALT